MDAIVLAGASDASVEAAPAGAEGDGAAARETGEEEGERLTGLIDFHDGGAAGGIFAGDAHGVGAGRQCHDEARIA